MPIDCPMIRRAVLRIARTPYVRSAIADRADLSAFMRRPDARIIAGVSTIGLSYVLGWPLIGLLGIVSVHLKAPLIVAVGGPVAYGLSHLVFLLGMYLTGYDYSKIFLRWAVRKAVETLLKMVRRPSSGK